MALRMAARSTTHGEILQHDAGRLERNLDFRRRRGVPSGEILHVVFGHLIAIAVPQQRFQQQADRKR
jgi:hypothetical protein